MKYRNAGLIVGVISLCAGLATTTAMAAGKNSYAYEGISLTRTTAPDGCDAINHYASLTGRSCNDTSTRWKVYAGLRLNRHTGLELAYADLGRATANSEVTSGKYSGLKGTGRAKASGFGLSAVGYLPMNDEFELFAKAGAFRWRNKLSYSAAGESVDFSESGVSFAAGVGANYFFTEEIGLRAEYEVIKGVGDKGDFSGADVHLMSVGLMLRF